jgi:oxygen-dependent protoporphyrinogen oxidase
VPDRIPRPGSHADALRAVALQADVFRGGEPRTDVPRDGVLRDGAFRIAVIGGGVAGLATAYDLEREAAARALSLSVTVFEAASEVGGHLRTEHVDGYVLEAGPNGWLDSEPATTRLLTRLGLVDQVQRSEDAARRRFLQIGGRLRELPLSPTAFLKSDILPLRAKLRMAGELFVPPRSDLGQAAEDSRTDETVYDFGRRRLGRAFAETLLDPMVKGIFGGDARRLSLAAAFPRMVELEREHGSLFKALFRLSRQARRDRLKGTTEPISRMSNRASARDTSAHYASASDAAAHGASAAAGPRGILTSFRDGMAVLPATLRAALHGEIRTGAPVTRVKRSSDGWRVVAGGDEHGPFAAVIDAAPAHAAAQHLDDPELRRLLAGIPYAPMAVITLAYDRSRVGHPLDGFGMLNPTFERQRLLGALWTSSIYRHRAPAGKVLLRCMAGGAPDPDALRLTDDELAGLCRVELGALYQLNGPPERVWIFRHERAIAQYVPGHLARLAALAKARRRLPGLHLTGSSYGGVSVNHCLAAAEKTAMAVLEELDERAGTMGADQGAQAMRTAMNNRRAPSNIPSGRTLHAGAAGGEARQDATLPAGRSHDRDEKTGADYNEATG